MRSTVIITVIAAVLCVAAGVAIAGLPNTPPGADIVVVEIPTVETRPIASAPPVTVQPLPATTTSTSTTTTDVPTTTTTVPSDTTTTTTGPADALRDRSELTVAAANATDLSGVATTHAELLQAAGYVDVVPVDAEASVISTVYYQPGFDLEAARLATDLGWDPVRLASMSAIPALNTERTFDLVVLVGLDRT